MGELAGHGLTVLIGPASGVLLLELCQDVHLYILPCELALQFPDAPGILAQERWIAHGWGLRLTLLSDAVLMGVQSDPGSLVVGIAKVEPELVLMQQ